MSLVELRCPTCHAPLRAPESGTTLECAYCSAQLHPAAPAETRTVWALSIERVGPSNRARAAALLRSCTAVGDPEGIVERAPCEICVFDDELRAEAVRQALDEAGVVARLAARQVVVPPRVVLPDRAVHLESAGPDRIAVMKIVREHCDLGLAEAKQLVARAPCVVVDALEGSRATALVEALSRAGAIARLAE